MGTIFKQNFTTIFWTGGVRIQVQQITESVKVVLDSGIAVAGSSWNLTDTSKVWTPSHKWLDDYIKITAGSCAPQIRTISWSDRDTVVVSTQFDGSINNTSEYEIYNYYYPAGSGESTVPIVLELKLGEEIISDTYSTIVTDKTVVCSEEIEDSEQWVYLFWKPIPPGNYQWQLEVTDSDPVGTFGVMYDPDSTKFRAFEDSVELSGDYYSEVLRLDDESYENVMSVGDTFDSGFVANDGVDNVKVNKSSTYYEVVKTGKVATTTGGLKGRVATGSSVKVA